MDLNELKEDLEGLKEDHKWTKDVQRRPWLDLYLCTMDLKQTKTDYSELELTYTYIGVLRILKRLKLAHSWTRKDNNNRIFFWDTNLAKYIVSSSFFLYALVPPYAKWEIKLQTLNFETAYLLLP